MLTFVAVRAQWAFGSFRHLLFLDCCSFSINAAYFHNVPNSGFSALAQATVLESSVIAHLCVHIVTNSWPQQRESIPPLLMPSPSLVGCPCCHLAWLLDGWPPALFLIAGYQTAAWTDLRGHYSWFLGCCFNCRTDPRPGPGSFTPPAHRINNWQDSQECKLASIS